MTSLHLHYLILLPVLFVIHLFNMLDKDIYLPTCCQTLFILWCFLNSKKTVRIQQFTDGATIVLRRHYHTGLNKTKYGFPSICVKY